MNNYIVTFEYRVMVTAFAILAMFLLTKKDCKQNLLTSISKMVLSETSAIAWQLLDNNMFAVWQPNRIVKSQL